MRTGNEVSVGSVTVESPYLLNAGRANGHFFTFQFQKMKKDIHYKEQEGGGFIIRFREEYQDYELLEVPLYGSQEQHIGLFLSVESTKMYADQLA